LLERLRLWGGRRRTRHALPLQLGERLLWLAPSLPVGRLLRTELALGVVGLLLATAGGVRGAQHFVSSGE
jgi:hypothetical protein